MRNNYSKNNENSNNLIILEGARQIAQTELRHINRPIYQPTMRATKTTFNKQRLEAIRTRRRWLAGLTKLDNINSYQAMGMAFDHIDDLLHAGNFCEVDQIITQLEIDALSTELLIGILTTTGPARSKLKHRDSFFKRVEKQTHNRGEWEEGLLDGLE